MLDLFHLPVISQNGTIRFLRISCHIVLIFFHLGYSNPCIIIYILYLEYYMLV